MNQNDAFLKWQCALNLNFPKKVIYFQCFIFYNTICDCEISWLSFIIGTTHATKEGSIQVISHKVTRTSY